MANDKTPSRISVNVADDRLSAQVRIAGVGSPEFVPPTTEEIVVALTAASIELTEDVEARVAEVVAQCTQPAGTADGPTDTFVIAQGRPAVDATDAVFEWAPEFAARLAKPKDDERVDYFSVGSIVTVAEDTVIGRIVPAQPGTPARDVLGDEHPPRKPHGHTIKLGSGVRAGDTPEEVVATVAGRVVLGPEQVRVDEVLEISGDVDFRSGSVDSCVDVTVRGTVRANFSVQTPKSLSVDHVVEAAHVNVGGDVYVRGGVFGHDGRDFIRAGGSVHAALLNEACVAARGDIVVAREILNCTINCAGRIIGERGTIIGGHCYGRAGVVAKVIGSTAGVATVVVVGVDVSTLRQVRALEEQARALQKTSERIHASVEPLMANVRRLTPEQRERVTELTCKADELDLQVEDLQHDAARVRADGSPPEPAYIEVQDAVYPGVQLVIDGCLVRVQNRLLGPTRIQRRKVDKTTEVVAVNQRTASVTVLNSSDASLDETPYEHLAIPSGFTRLEAPQPQSQPQPDAPQT